MTVTDWDDLVATVLLGTARRPVDVDGGSGAGPLDTLLRGLNRGEPEATLLAAAAAVSLYRAAGYRPPSDPERGTGSAAPAEAWGRCSAVAAQTLVDLVESGERTLLGEWLTVAAEATRRVPEELLPDLLDLGAARADLRVPLLPVLGERGPWLAAQNPDWAWALGADDDVWETGSRDARLAFLQRLRATDPARARETVERTWAEEAPEDRAAFVGAFAAGLSLDDEPFLERARVDRRKEVRRAAIDLLARLPGSQLCGRMVERVRPLVSTGGRLRKRLDVEFPAEVTPEMAADGVERKPPPNLGERAWWLHQLLAATPLSFWGDPAEAVALARHGDRWPNLLGGWVAAVQRQRDPAWARALMAVSDEPTSWVVQVLPQDEAQKFARDLIARRGLGDASTLSVVASVPGPWGILLSEAVVRALAQAVASGALPHVHPSLALRLDPSLSDEAAAALRSGADEFLQVLAYRNRMRQELQL